MVHDLQQLPVGCCLFLYIKSMTKVRMQQNSKQWVEDRGTNWPTKHIKPETEDRLRDFKSRFAYFCSEVAYRKSFKN